MPRVASSSKTPLDHVSEAVNMVSKIHSILSRVDISDFSGDVRQKFIQSVNDTNVAFVGLCDLHSAFFDFTHSER